MMIWTPCCGGLSPTSGPQSNIAGFFFSGWNCLQGAPAHRHTTIRSCLRFPHNAGLSCTVPAPPPSAPSRALRLWQIDLGASSLYTYNISPGVTTLGMATGQDMGNIDEITIP